MNIPSKNIMNHDLEMAFRFNFRLDGKDYVGTLIQPKENNPWGLWHKMKIDGLRDRQVHYDGCGYPWVWFKKEKLWLYHLPISDGIYC